jgi:hypothetical protein
MADDKKTPNSAGEPIVKPSKGTTQQTDKTDSKKPNNQGEPIVKP